MKKIAAGEVSVIRESKKGRRARADDSDTNGHYEGKDAPGANLFRIRASYIANWRHSCSCSIMLVGAFAREHDQKRSAEHVDVEPSGPVAHVIRIQLHSVLVSGLVASGDLPHASQAGCDLRIEQEIFPVLWNFGVHNRAGAD
jgi:hypothetical protein